MYMLWFNFILGLIFFVLFLGRLMYDNEFETKGKKINHDGYNLSKRDRSA